MAAGWRKLNVGVVGGGIGGMCSAIALRRAGHDVVIYERSDFAGEVGASVSCAANGTRWLHEWKVDVAKGDPVILKQLINRDWKTGEPISEYSLEDYEERWGHVYNMFHRQDMHAMLKDTALEEAGEGSPAKLIVNHKVRSQSPLNSGGKTLTLSISAKPSTLQRTPSPLRTESQQLMT
jgi:salicylate hydroxylase